MRFQVVVCVHIDSTGVTKTFGIRDNSSSQIVASGLTQTQANNAANAINSDTDVAAGRVIFI